MSDALSSVLELIEVKGSVYFNCQLGGRWGIDVAPSQLSEFHVVTDGHCWLKMYDKNSDIALQTGDIVFFPHGHAHAMMSHTDSPLQSASDIVNSSQLTEFGPLIVGDPTSINTHLLCGFFDFSAFPNHLFLSALPSLIHIHHLGQIDLDWMEQIIAMIRFETTNQQQGRSAIVQRLVEILFAQIIRAYVRQNQTDACILKAMSDHKIGKCLNAIHADLAKNWTINELAHVSAMSRTAFIGRFQKLSGFTPGDYLFQLRMLKAQRLLTMPDASLSDVSEQVGYQSEAAFSKAFKKFAGFSPGAFKKQQRV